MSRPYKIFVGMIVGILLGMLAHFVADGQPWLEFAVANIAQPLGQLFLRLILMIVVPLIFSVLVLGVFEFGDIKEVGRVGVKTLLYTIFASSISVVVGLTFVAIFAPGKGLEGLDFSRLGIDLEAASRAAMPSSTQKGVVEILLDLIPKNPMRAAVNALDGEIPALMVFALIFGMALVMIRRPQDQDPLVAALVTLRDVCMKVVDFAMGLAPLGIGGLMFSVTATFGWAMLLVLGKFVLVVLGGLLFQQLVVYGLILKLYTRRSPWVFIKEVREVIITAFSTASSNATLPTAIRVTQDRLGVDKKVASFVLTIGSAANQNGTALFEGVTILFLAQVFGRDLSLAQQTTVLLMSIVAGIGTAGIPGGSLPMIVIILQTIGIPGESIGLILGVDRLLDMSRTVLNVTGDIVAACVVDASEKGRA